MPKRLEIHMMAVTERDGHSCEGACGAMAQRNKVRAYCVSETEWMVIAKKERVAWLPNATIANHGRRERSS